MIEAARKADAPIIVQFSSGGSQFYAGKAPGEPILAVMMYACMNVCMYVCMCIYIYIYIYTHL